MTERVVFDTSSLASAAIRVGAKPNQALMHALACCTVCASEQLIAELREVISRERFDRYLSAGDRQKFLDLVQENFKMFAVLATDVERVDPACRDPRDNFVLALALVAEAAVIVSSDHDLLVLHPWSGVSILTPAQFLEQIAS
jgi:uncharacterized protein